MDNDNDMLGLSQVLFHQSLRIDEIASECRGFLKNMELCSSLQTAASFGVLLTLPELQSNCLRLEALVHIAVAYATGKCVASDKFVRHGFKVLGRTRCGRFEDPSEDVFVTSIATSRGNFRVLEGIWESAGFFLQRVIDVVESMPADSSFDQIREPIFALLQLSEEMCVRAELYRYMLGGDVPLSAIPESITDISARAKGALSFSFDELKAMKVKFKNISPFIFDYEKATELQPQTIGHTSLERYPLIREDKALYLVLPTAISATIRRFLLDCMDAAGMRDKFIAALAAEYTKTFAKVPVGEKGMGAPIRFQRVGSSIVANVAADIDAGRHLHLSFFMDTLEDFEKTGLAGLNPDPNKDTDVIDKAIDLAYEHASSQEGFRSGVSLLVGCGIGRGIVSTLSNKDRDNWRIEHISAPSLSTLGWSPGYKPLTLWRLIDATDNLEAMNVSLQNINGLLNMFAWVRNLEGHLVPHGKLPDEFASTTHHALISIDQTSLRDLRHDVLTMYDPHVVQSVSGGWVEVRKEGYSLFKEDAKKPLYAVWERSANGSFPAVYLTATRAWWCDLKVPETTSAHYAYQRWQLITVWLTRAVPILERAFPTLPYGPLLWVAEFEMSTLDGSQEVPQVSYSQARDAISTQANDSQRIVYTKANSTFELAHFNVDNVAERALVDAFVDAVASLAGTTINNATKTELVANIVGQASARQMHAFRARHFRDFVQQGTHSSPIKVNQMDDAAIRIGLGWQIRSRTDGPYLTDKPGCIKFLNTLVRHLEDELCVELRNYDRLKLVIAALTNIEVAAKDKDIWDKTSAAVMALHDDKEATLEALAKHDFSLNALTHNCRILLEMALCECPTGSGFEPGKLDISRLMARAGLIAMMGGWSDAIRWDVMEPTLRITPLGDVHGRLGYIDEIIEPFGRAAHKTHVRSEVDHYASNLKDREIRDSIHDAFDAAFVNAWEEQCGASLDDFRLFVEFVENLGIKRDALVFTTRRSELRDIRVDDRRLAPEIANIIINYLLFVPRTNWRSIPEGYEERDINPWRFRRRLSVLRKPLLQVTDEEDPLIVIAPGLLSDAWVYMVGNYHRGDFPVKQLSPLMTSWQGTIAAQRGRQFNEAVCTKLKELGWETDLELPVTKLLRQGFERNYGDVDVLAWDSKSGRVLIVECKDLQYKKTYGEIAEQLADFRGEIGPDGKPDALRKHLDRVSVIRDHQDAVAKQLKLKAISTIESHLVFKHQVPIEYALGHMSGRVVLHSFDQLHIGAP